MKLHPPPVVNQRVTADMLHWVMRQSNTVTMNTATNEFTITPGKGAQDYPINLSVRITMLRELIAILAYNGFNAYEQTTGTLMVKKRGWSFEVPGILDQMPFPEYLPHQINKAYEHYQYDVDLDYNRKVHGKDHLYPYEPGWTLDTPAQHAAKQQSADDAFSEMIKYGMTTMKVNSDHSHNYPSRDHLLEIRKIVEDSIDDTDKD